MDYKLKLAAINGDVIPLYIVAVAQAMRDATAGGTPYHDATFKGRLTGYILDLLEEVCSGRLKVCDSFGSPLAVDNSIAATEHFGYAMRYVKEPDWEKLHREIPPIGEGVWDFTHLDLGPREIDKTKPHIFWFTKLKTLNDWAKERGDSFSICHEGVGWVDERGYVVGATDQPENNQDKAVPTKSKGKTSQPVSDPAPTNNGWKPTARIIGKDIAEKHRNLSLDQIADKVHDEMERRQRKGERGMTGRGGRVPSSGSIRRHALKGIKLSRP